MKTLTELQMAAAWGCEWTNLSRDDRSNVKADFANSGIIPLEYVRRIYVGNLQAYANTLRPRKIS